MSVEALEDEDAMARAAEQRRQRLADGAVPDDRHVGVEMIGRQRSCRTVLDHVRAQP